MLIYRLKSAVPWALRHLLVSTVIATLLAILAIDLWFPAPFWKISAGGMLFFTVVAVDIVCGPLLTLLLIHSDKSRFARSIDFLLIGIIQISALIYGLYTLGESRPIAVVFEVDRFHVISFADIDDSKPEFIPDWVKPWGGEPVRVLGVRSAKDAREKMESVDASLQGVEPGQRPWWWQDYALSAPQVKARAKPLSALLAMHPDMASRIEADAARALKTSDDNEEKNPENLLWLPVVSRKSMDWVALIDPQSARIRGYIHADGFGD